ncbi:MAG TPA: acylphosphatase [Aggregatilineales bacterium]|nr:acylphosphatase [Aggregatilineales bacterium]
MRELHAIVYGRVQGVSFRFNALAEARRLDIKGWVKNRPDGTVETTACGSQPALDSYLDWLQRGPTGAWVSQVETDWRETPQDYDSFEILYGTE